MNTLDKIIAFKRKEVLERKGLFPTRLLEQSIFFNSPTVSLVSYLRRPDKSGIIAEFKRRSPSRGVINSYASVERTTLGYMQAGASALSVLTDKEFFGGTNDDLTTARKYNFCPILRKDFVIDEYQIIEARSIGADAILLIASALTVAESSRFSKFAQSLGMQVLLEVHTKDELVQHLESDPDLVGVNNRDLKTFQVDVGISKTLSEFIPAGKPRVSESGISDVDTIRQLRQFGFDGFLIGETFMKHSRPDQAALKFIKELSRYDQLNFHGHEA